MFQVEIDGKTYDAKVTFYTAHLYEMEFRSDLVQDLFGVQTAEPALGFDGEGGVAKVDFTRIKWTAVVKVLWAAIKTADDSTPPFSQWMREATGANLWYVQELIGDEVADCFFRASAPGEDAEEEVR